MRILNQFSGTWGTLFQLPRPVTFPKGKKCARLRREISLTLASTDSSNYNLTNADILALFQAVFAAVTCQFGDKAPDVADNAIPFNVARAHSLVTTGRDATVGAPTAGTPVAMAELNDYPVTSITVPANGTIAIKLELPRMFVVENFGPGVDKWCPGKTQMSQLADQFQTATVAWTADSAKVTVSGQFTCSWLTDDLDSSEDTWVKVTRAMLTNSASLEIPSPDAGMLLGLADTNAVGLSTAITIFSLYTNEGVDLQTQIQAYRVVDDTLNLLREGALNPQTIFTFLYLPDQNSAAIRQLPISAKFTFKAANQDVAQFKLVWFLAPQIDDNYRTSIVRPNVNRRDQNGFASTMVGVNAAYEEKRGEDMGPMAALSGITFHPASDNEFASHPGYLWVDGQPEQLVVPKHVKARAAAAVGAAVRSGLPEPVALAQASAALARAVPGAQTAGGQVTAAHIDIAGHIAPLMTRRTGPALTAATKQQAEHRK